MLKLIFVTLSIAVFSQDMRDIPYRMTTAQNMAWLTALKDAGKAKQLSLIQKRFFKQTPLNINANEDVPLLIIDGIPVSEQIDRKVRDFLKSQLMADKVEIKVLDKEPEGIYVNKRWT